MANEWGTLSWSAGLWGQQADNVVQVNNPNDEPWGTYAYGENDFGGSAGNLGVSTGSVTVAAEINSGWGRLTWGENAWGIQGDVLVTGIGLSTGIGTGSVTIDVAPELTGEQQNLTLADVTAFGNTEIYLADNPLQGLTITQGTVDAAPDAEVIGNQLNIGVGTVTAFNEQGWGRDDWGTEVWGAQGIWASVQLDNTNLGLGATSGEREPWGTNAWGGQDAEEWGGTSITDVGILTIASPTGIELTAAEGTVDPSPDATVVGIGLTASVAVGSVVEADANVTTTGNALEIAQGQAELDAVTFGKPTGQQLNTSLNSAVAGASALVLPTGVQANIALGNINIQSWQIVDTGSTVSYSEVSTGTSVTWNDIDTAA